MSVETLKREFHYLSMVLEDPDPEMTPDEVKDFYSSIYTELTQSNVSDPEMTADAVIYKFEKAVGTKGLNVKEVAEGYFDDTRTGKNDDCFGIMTGIALAISESRSTQKDRIIPPSECQGMI